MAADLVYHLADDEKYYFDHGLVFLDRDICQLRYCSSTDCRGPVDTTHVFATWAFKIGIEGGDIPLGATVSLFMVPILGVAAVMILRDINKRGNEA